MSHAAHFSALRIFLLALRPLIRALSLPVSLPPLRSMVSLFIPSCTDTFLPLETTRYPIGSLGVSDHILSPREEFSSLSSPKWHWVPPLLSLLTPGNAYPSPPWLSALLQSAVLMTGLSCWIVISVSRARPHTHAQHSPLVKPMSVSSTQTYSSGLIWWLRSTVERIRMFQKKHKTAVPRFWGPVFLWRGKELGEKCG